MTGFSIWRIRLEENSVRVTAQARPKGIPIISAPMVTSIEPTIIGSIPKIFSLGYQSIPKRKFLIPYLIIIGVPSTKIKKVISAKKEIAEKAIIVRAIRINFSFRSSCVINSYFLIGSGI